MCEHVWEGVRAPTGEHGEDGSKGVQLESIDHAARVEELQAHEAESDNEEHDVEHLGHHGQPEDTCGGESASLLKHDAVVEHLTTSDTRAKTTGPWIVDVV